MATTARDAGTFTIGGDLEVTRLGFGAMRIVGDGVWGPPKDHDAAVATIRETRELGVDFIDTADSYGPDLSEQLIREALHPYGDTKIATKAGLLRTGPQEWHPCGRPEYLKQELEVSLRTLGVDQLDLWQLHRIDPQVPREEQRPGDTREKGSFAYGYCKSCDWQGSGRRAREKARRDALEHAELCSGRHKPRIATTDTKK